MPVPPSYPAPSQTTYGPYPTAAYSSPFDYAANLSDYAQPTGPQDYSVDGPPLELVHEIYGDFPTGVAVDLSNRLFFNIPRSAGTTPATVTVATNFTAEAPWPNEAIQNCLPGQNVSTCFVNVQSVVIDSTQERIWILDTGMPPGASVAVEYGAKVWAFNLTTADSIRNYVIPYALSDAGLNINDIRFNLSLGTQGIGFLSDEQGSLLTLDLDTGVYTRRLFNTTVTTADVNFTGSYDGAPFYSWKNTTRTHLSIGADGIALAAQNLYFAPLASRRLYAISQAALTNASLTDAELLPLVQPVGQIGTYTEGFTSDDQGRVYMGTAEQNSITYFNTSLSSLTNSTTRNGLTTGLTGTIPAADLDPQPFVRSALIQWADSMCIENGYLWFTTNQLPLMPSYRRDGVDLRVKPFKIYRTWVGAGPAV